MTFDREPDLDNANVGMRDITYHGKLIIKEITKLVVSFLFYIKLTNYYTFKDYLS